MSKLHSIKEQTYEIIKNKILTQEFPLGSRINIGELSRELSVSNSPIREALSQLEKQGLVITTRNSGTNVVSLSLRDRYEHAQMLLFLMLGAYDYCRASGRTGKLIEKMEPVLARQKEFFAVQAVYEYTEQATGFDRCIIEATDNQYLLDLFDDQAPLFFLGSLFGHQEGESDWLVSMRQHEVILRAIKNGDHALVMETLRAHYYKPVWDLR
ncbi:MAG: GntR family transcriptional regulator [Deltaproteobacteria bacterium]|jgi:DNA-binding GntR family transcriptional regulator|nr:GntR family transcriptional regulator [Deltaproteobacteria bacterium]